MINSKIDAKEDCRDLARISFNTKEFKEWLVKIGCDDCQYFVCLVDNKIVHKWGSCIQGKITMHSDIELQGVIE